MQVNVPLRAGILVMAFGLSFAAFAQEQTDGASEQIDKIIATIGDKTVYQSELTFAESDLDPQFAQLPPEQRTAAALSALLDIKLMAQQAENAGLGKDELFQRRVEFLKDRALHNEYFKAKVIDKISDEKVKARYDKEVAATVPEQEVKARHILVDSLEQAKAIVAELNAGQDFVELAKEKSTGPSGPQGGDLGYFTKGRMVPEFETAAFALEPGSFTAEPIKTQFGWHIIKVEDKRDTPPPPFEKVMDQISRVLLQEEYLALLQEARATIEVDVKDENLKKLLDSVKPLGDK